MSYAVDKISHLHLNVLLLLGLALFGGTIGGRLFQKIRIPQVVGYIVIGILIGESGLKIVDHALITALQPFTYFALGLIGFMIGGELKKEVILKYGKQFISILLFEGVGAFLAVSVLVGLVGTFLLGNWKLAWALGLLLGAISSATAPAATTAVLKEYKTRGPLTRTVLGVVAMDDALALFLFAIAASVAGNLSGNVRGGILGTFTNPLYEIGGSAAIGCALGLVLNKFLRKYIEEERLLVFSIGTVLLVCGLALTIHVDMLLAAMTLGAVVTNFVPRKSKEVFKLVEGFTPPLYILFFVLVGAEFNVSYMTMPILLLGCVYLVGRSAGKAVGSVLGARISGAPKIVRKYLPLCLFSQAGVAIGLSILASNYFPGDIGNAIVIIITATAFVLEIIGPTFVRIAVTKAGEAGLDVSEDDLVRGLKVKEIMDSEPPLIYESMQLMDILKIFTEGDNLYYPVVNKGKELQGIITVEGIKQTFLETDVGGLILANDLMQPVVAKVDKEMPISEAREALRMLDIEYLPVVDKGNKIEGLIERKKLNKFISTKIIELQRQADSLEKA